MQLKIHNPNGLPTVDYRTVTPLQGELKTLSDANAAKLKAVLQKRGFDVPLFLWQDGDVFYLLDGHQRQRVMVAEDMSDQGSYLVPYLLIEARTMDEAKSRLLEITSQYGTITYEGWDAFTAELDEAELLEAVQFDALPLLGQHDDDEPAAEEDEAPEVSSEPPDSKKGEVYLLGRHRLYCGNAANLPDVEKLMDGAKAKIIFTDPPYGVNYGYDNANLLKEKGDTAFHWSKSRTKSDIENDNLSIEELCAEIIQPAFQNMYLSAADDCSLYVTAPQGSNNLHIARAIMAAGWQVKHQLIWVKNAPVFSMGRLDYDYQHEPIFYGWKKKHHFYGKGEFLKSIWEIPKPLRSDDHPTMKPVALVANALENSSQAGDIVLDLFGGSGTTLAAADQLGRTCYMMELDPKYCDVIRKRWHKLQNDGDETGWQEATPMKWE